jgi:limonene-1,2-epoxide hydrolase
VTVSRIEENLALIRRFWHDLYARDFDKVGAYFAEDGHYEDVPAPDAGAVGPAAVAARLRVGLEPIERYVHHLHRMVADAESVVTEHTEEWHWGSGESVALPFVSIHVIREGRIALWRDYWDMNTLMSAAPQWWVEHIMREAAAQGLSGSSGATSTER